ncbi:MAG: pilus assembly protein TadG-related protein [Actinomycetota bacterium]
MKSLKLRSHDEDGAVLIVVALVTVVLLILSAGGVMLLTLYGSQREMQKSADQAALAAAAALPLLNPGQTMDALPLVTYYELSDDAGLDVPVRGLENVPDPRAVACAYGTRALQSDSANLVSKFGNSFVGSGYCANEPWSDGRVGVTLNSLGTPLSQCLSSLTTDINSVISELESGLNGLVSLTLSLLGLTQEEAEEDVEEVVLQLEALLASVQNLEALSPALLTPEVTATVTDRVSPPYMQIATGGDGVEMTVSATAERRLKNAVVLPKSPGLLDVDLNAALAETKPEIENAMSEVNAQLNTLVGQLGLGECEDLLDPNEKLYRDISDIYNPPTSGAAPSGRDLLSGATAAAQRAAGDSGNSVDALAGEAFVVINEREVGPKTISQLLGPLVDLLGLSSLTKSLQIPAMDVVIVAAHNLEDGNISNPDLITESAEARGLFTATLKN